LRARPVGWSLIKLSIDGSKPLDSAVFAAIYCGKLVRAKLPALHDLATKMRTKNSSPCYHARRAVATESTLMPPILNECNVLEEAIELFGRRHLPIAKV
jgi:hypothetical protein